MRSNRTLKAQDYYGPPRRVNWGKVAGMFIGIVLIGLLWTLLWFVIEKAHTEYVICRGHGHPALWCFTGIE